MNLLNKCTNNEIELLKEAGIIIENKDYTKEELERHESKIIDHIMSQSSTQIQKLHNQYSNIFRVINEYLYN